VVIPAVFAAAGCETDGNSAVRKYMASQVVKTPSMDNFPKADYELARRVDEMGNRLIQLNAPIAVEPFFHTIGVPESVLFHRGPNDLFISEGLVKLCKTDAELAAVMCSELGQMVAEKKAVRRVGADRSTIPEIALPGGTPVMTGGGTPYDAARQAELAYQDKVPRAAPTIDPVDASKQARQLMSTAGFDPVALDQVQPLLKQSDRGAIIRKQMSGSAPAPKWEQ
jgi:predicted Zn-dependent protease